MRCSSLVKSPPMPCCAHPTWVGVWRLLFWCSSVCIGCGCPSAVLVSSRLTHRTCVPHGSPLIVRAGGSCPRVFVTLRLLFDGSCRRAFRIHLGCDRTSGSKLLQHVLKGCCEKITLWVFAGHWLRAPRTRGWTDCVLHRGHVTLESPAHAGMDRAVWRQPTPCSDPGKPGPVGDGDPHTPGTLTPEHKKRGRPPPTLLAGDGPLRSPWLMLAAHSLQERRPLRGGGVQVTQVTVLGVAYRSTTFSCARLHAVATTAVAVAGLVPLSGHHQRAPCISSMRVRDSETGRAALRSSAKVRS